MTLTMAQEVSVRCRLRDCGATVLTRSHDGMWMTRWGGRMIKFSFNESITMEIECQRNHVSVYRIGSDGSSELLTG